MRSQRIVLVAPLVAALVVVAGACGDPAEPPGPLTIGVRSDVDGFHVLGEQESVPILLGANGLNMIVPSLRALDVNPNAPDPTVEVEIGGILMAADIEGGRADMQADGDGYVLWDLRVPFQTELCCYNCAIGEIRAHLEDTSGRTFEGSVRVLLERGGCPDLSACCGDANACPDPSLTQVCE